MDPPRIKAEYNHIKEMYLACKDIKGDDRYGNQSFRCAVDVYKKTYRITGPYTPEIIMQDCGYGPQRYVLIMQQALKEQTEERKV
jgi:hypothetical protein